MYTYKYNIIDRILMLYNSGLAILILTCTSICNENSNHIHFVTSVLQEAGGQENVKSAEVFSLSYCVSIGPRMSYYMYMYICGMGWRNSLLFM